MKHNSAGGTEQGERPQPHIAASLAMGPSTEQDHWHLALQDALTDEAKAKLWKRSLKPGPFVALLLAAAGPTMPSFHPHLRLVRASQP